MAQVARKLENDTRVASFTARSVADMLEDSTMDELEELVQSIEDEPSEHSVFVFHLGNPSLVEPQGPASLELDRYRRWEKLVDRIEHLPIVLIACVDGTCVSDCLGLALACDLRLATERTRFRFPEIHQGLLPGMGAFRLSKFLGLGIAKRMVFRAESIGAGEAHRLGLVDHVCTPETFDRDRGTLIREMGKVDGKVARLARRLLNESHATRYDDAIGHYLAAQSHCFTRLRGES